MFYPFLTGCFTLRRRVKESRPTRAGPSWNSKAPWFLRKFMRLIAFSIEQNILSIYITYINYIKNYKYIRNFNIIIHQTKIISIFYKLIINIYFTPVKCQAHCSSFISFCYMISQPWLWRAHRMVDQADHFMLSNRRKKKKDATIRPVMSIHRKIVWSWPICAIRCPGQENFIALFRLICLLMDRRRNIAYITSKKQ